MADLITGCESASLLSRLRTGLTKGTVAASAFRECPSPARQADFLTIILLYPVNLLVIDAAMDGLLIDAISACTCGSDRQLIPGDRRNHASGGRAACVSRCIELDQSGDNPAVLCVRSDRWHTLGHGRFGDALEVRTYASFPIGARTEAGN